MEKTKELFGLETEHDVDDYYKAEDGKLVPLNKRGVLQRIIDELKTPAGLEIKSVAYGFSYGTDRKYFSRHHGGRFYIDLNRVLESCTPECPTIKDVALWHLAQEKDIQRAILSYEKNNQDHRLVIMKDSSNRNGSTFGSHENYLIDTEKSSYVFYYEVEPYLIPLLVVRQIICGAGKISKEVPFIFADDDILSQRIHSLIPGNMPLIVRNSSEYEQRRKYEQERQKQWGNRIEKIFSKEVFQISQRSDYITQVIGSVSVYNRPLIHTKGQNSGSGLRFHLICGDSNRCPKSLFLKMGILKLFFKTYCENGFDQLPPQIHNPLLALVKISRDPELKKKIRLKDGRLVSPFYILEWYFEQFEKHLQKTGQLEGENLEILTLAKEVLEYLKAGEFKKLFGVVDWITLKMLLDNVCKFKGLSYSDMEIKKLEFSYFNVHPFPQRSIFEYLKKQNKIQMMFSDREIQIARNSAPQSKAAFRVFLMRLLNSSGLKYDLDPGWNKIKGRVLVPVRFLKLLTRYFPSDTPFFTVYKNLYEGLRTSILKLEFVFDTSDANKIPIEEWSDISDLANFIKIIQIISQSQRRKAVSP